MDVNCGAKYNDRFNVNGEWAEIHNDSDADVSLERWWLRDSALRRYTFHTGAVVPAGGSVRLRTGYRDDTADELHWGLDRPPFENPSYDARAAGDGGYLFDPRGTLRVWVIYNQCRRPPVRAAAGNRAYQRAPVLVSGAGDDAGPDRLRPRARRRDGAAAGAREP